MGVGIMLTIVLPLLLEGRTHQNADEAQLIERSDATKINKHHNLTYLINWRDLIIAIFTGVFTLQFAAAEKIGSTSHTFAMISLPGYTSLSDIAMIVTVCLIPLMLPLGLLLADRLKLTCIQLPIKYWSLFILCVIPWYLLAFCFVYSPDK